MAIEKRKPRVGELAGYAAAAGQEARIAANRRRLATVRLTDEERRICIDELSEQYALGRLDEDELHRRVDLMYAAATHADLRPIFTGLPVPSLYRPGPRQPSKWRWAAFAGTVWVALPFVLAGLVLLIFGKELAAAIFGLPALFGVLLTYRWAAKSRNR